MLQVHPKTRLSIAWPGEPLLLWFMRFTVINYLQGWIDVKCWQDHKKTGKITKKRAKNGRFFQNARLNGHARFKTGDFSTLLHLHLILAWLVIHRYGQRVERGAPGVEWTVFMPPGTRGDTCRWNRWTIHLTKSLAHFHWHADTYMLAIAASNILMYRHSYRFPQPGSVDTGVSVPIILDEFAVVDVKKNNGAEAV